MGARRPESAGSAAEEWGWKASASDPLRPGVELRYATFSAAFPGSLHDVLPLRTGPYAAAVRRPAYAAALSHCVELRVMVRRRF